MPENSLGCNGGGLNDQCHHGMRLLCNSKLRGIERADRRSNCRIPRIRTETPCALLGGYAMSRMCQDICLFAQLLVSPARPYPAHLTILTLSSSSLRVSPGRTSEPGPYSHCSKGHTLITVRMKESTKGVRQAPAIAADPKAQRSGAGLEKNSGDDSGYSGEAA